MTTIIKPPHTRLVFWRAAGCFKSPLAILETLEDPDNGLTMKDNGKPIFIRALEHSKYVPKQGDLLVNWGNGGFNTFDALKWTPLIIAPKILNHPNNVSIATNKIKTFKALEVANVSTVPWTTDELDAKNWLLDNFTVISRTTLDGCCGEGIVITDPANNNLLPHAPLYTRYVKKMHEFRVHVFNGKVIDVTQKRLKKGKPSNGLIRNVDDGWKFSHKLSLTPTDLHQLGIDAVKACGLDFGAVDIIWNKHYNKCYVLEVNTAPGLELRKTINAYANSILGVFNEKIN